MSFSKQQLQDLTQQAILAAQSAGRLIIAYGNREISIGYKENGTSQASQIVTEVDLKAQAVIVEQLQSCFIDYDLTMLTEETPDDGTRHKKSAFWCIDPMDGSLAFVKQVAGYTVSIALVSQRGVPLIGVVYNPLEETTYHAYHGQGAFKNGQPIKAPQLDPELPLVLRTDYSFQSDSRLEQTRSGLQLIAERIGVNGADIEFQIGAVNNACSILEAPNGCYFKYPRSASSGGSLWDYAATACIFHEAGAVASDIHGNPMELNRVDSTFMNHRGILYSPDKALAEQIIKLSERLLTTS
jgi:3'(2'), 5'-bisphosphate nucleotidase/myo-inositol-1(or 4)-monophosphatase